MKFTAYANTIIEAIERATDFQKSRIPEWEAVKITAETDSGRVVIESFRTGYHAISEMRKGTCVESSGTIAINAADLKKFLGEFKGKAVSFADEDGEIRVECDGASKKTHMHLDLGIMETDMAEDEDFSYSDYLNSTADDFVSSISKAIAMCPKDPSNRMGFVLFDFHDGVANVMGTDSYRMYASKNFQSVKDCRPFNLPVDVARIIAKSPKNLASVSVGISESGIASFIIDGDDVSTRIFAAEKDVRILPWRRLVGNSCDSMAKIGTKTALKAVSFLEKMVGKKAYAMVDINAGKISAKCENGAYEHVIECESSHDCEESAFNVSYLKDALKLMNGEKLTVANISAKKSLIMRDIDGSIFLIMPVRI